ncbi:HPr family phosphocarrier protein [Spongiibacter nanhainus]|uniref:HPr family phosphocarrier protein n=1 Tax=Spongiibacter nanhainus TaxID=2794344 RepID=A0A7T4R285_9GAMM|nr:HPr family phosphocarrier protein [Spongiibacter nanhainus]QQD19035.1 HPr family phosphocarrier protein [Spongiibacter nanhainus]
MVEQQLTIINKLGLHARAASKLVSTAAAFGAHVEIGVSEKFVDGKSIMAVMMLAASRGTDIIIRCEGDDADAALEAITTLINNRFDEPE